jgi:RHS repeat-associated protein
MIHTSRLWRTLSRRPHLPWSSLTRAGIAVVFSFLLTSVPASAQCNPSFDPDCAGTGQGPDISITPDTGTYTIVGGETIQVEVTIAISDMDGLNDATRQVRLTVGSTSKSFDSLTWTPNNGGTTGTLKGIVTLTTAGENVLTAQMADKMGHVGSGRAVLTVQQAHPRQPVILLTPHHNDFRDVTNGYYSTLYPLATYTSMGKERSLALFYSSEHANPSAFVQVDARPSISWAIGMSLRMLEPVGWNAVSREYFFESGHGYMLSQRMGAEWSMAGQPTGIYSYLAAVRQHGPDGYDDAVVPVRVLVINEANSRYGAGWSLALPRIHLSGVNVLLNEGNGTARAFMRSSCGASHCDYITPAGDFTKLTYNTVTGAFVRTFTDGSETTFDSRGLLISDKDPTGGVTTYTWQNTADAQHVPVLWKVTDPANKVTTLEYTAAGYLNKITDPAGRVSVFTHTGNRLTGISGLLQVAYTYDSTARMTGFIGGSGWWDIGYARTTVSSLTAPEVTVRGTRARPVTWFRSLQAATVLPDGQGTTLATRVHALPSDQTFIETTDPESHSFRVAVDRYGNPTRITDPVGVTKSYTWNDDGLPKETDGSYWWNERGQLLLKTVNMGVVYEASYGSSNRPEFVSSGGSTTWYEYGSRGEVLRSWYGKNTDRERTATTYEYDSQLRLIRATGPKGARTEWTFGTNTWGNVESIRHVREDGVVATTALTYDHAGRQRTITNADGSTTTIHYDDLNRVVKSFDSAQRMEQFTYTGPHLTQVIDRAGKVYQFSYNALGWLESEIHPDGKRRSFTYNLDGLVHSRTDRRNAVVWTAWDPNHRMYERTADGVTTKWRYPDPHTTVITNSEGTETISYIAALERLGSVTTTFAGLPSRKYEIQRVTDPQTGWTVLGTDAKTYLNGSLLRTDSVKIYPRFGPVDPTYRSELSVQDPSGNVTNLAFDVAGRHVRTLFPNGVTENRSYTTEGQPTSIWFSSTAVSRALGSNFAYDLMHRLSTRGTIAGDVQWSYGYDASGQLSVYQKLQPGTPLGCDPTVETCEPGWNVTESTSYTYDAAGNRTDSGATLETASNRYKTFNGLQLSYDAEGNLVRKYKAGILDQTFTWNDLGQLASVTTNGSTVTYGYSGSGRRARRTVGGQSNYFVYDDDDLLLEIDGSGNPYRSYTHLPGTDNPLSLRVTSGGVDSYYYYTTAHSGHVSGLLNATGSVAAQYRYTPFGVVEASSGPIANQPLRYMSREQEPATGLYYVRNRWYDPALARFVSEDPIGLEGGSNPYAYVGNDPVNKRDPSGLLGCRVMIHFSEAEWRAIPDRENTVKALLANGICLDLRDTIDDGRAPDAAVQLIEGFTSYPRGFGRAVEQMIRSMGLRGQCEAERAAAEDALFGVALEGVIEAIASPQGRKLLFEVARSYVEDNRYRVMGRLGAGAMVTTSFGPLIGFPAALVAGYGDVRHAVRQGQTSLEDFTGSVLGGSRGLVSSSPCR